MKDWGARFRTGGITALQELVEAVNSNNRNVGGQFLVLNSEEHLVRGIGLVENLEDILCFEKAGPRRKIFFDPSKVKSAIISRLIFKAFLISASPFIVPLTFSLV